MLLVSLLFNIRYYILPCCKFELALDALLLWWIILAWLRQGRLNQLLPVEVVDHLVLFLIRHEAVVNHLMVLLVVVHGLLMHGLCNVVENHLLLLYLWNLILLVLWIDRAHLF